MGTETRNSHSIIITQLVLVGLVFAVLSGNVATATTVNIPDAGLEAAIRFTLGIPTDPITDTDLAGLLSLSAIGKGITDLTGLEDCVTLGVLYIDDNNIRNLHPLSGLTSLEELGLADNNISNCGPLSGLTSLRFLSLTRNNVRNIRPLTGLASLEILYVNGNRITNIQPLVDNTGLDAGDLLNLVDNPLGCKAITIDIPILQGRGVAVRFDPLATLKVSIHPRVLNLKSKGKWITCYISSSEGCDVGDIDVASIRLENSLEVQHSHLFPWWGTLMVKFSRPEVLAMVGLGEVELTLTGEFNSGLRFEGSDTIRVISPGK